MDCSILALGIKDAGRSMFGPFPFRGPTLPAKHGALGPKNQAVLPLSAAAQVHHTAELVERHVEPLLALEAMQREVIITAAGGKVRQVFGPAEVLPKWG